jgi:DNA-binding CsgD family transcriptional regulator
MTEIIDRVAGGQGTVVFLSGEPGIGKTRLARWTLAAAGGRGFQVLQAGAFPLEKNLPYALLIAAFKPALRRLNPGQRSLFARDLRHLGLLFADLEQSPPQVLGDPALEKTRLFEDVSRLIELLAAQSPVALFLDDLHWADNASIELLHYVGRGIADQSVLVLAAYAPQELDSARGLRGLVRGLQRSGVGEEIQLRGLTPQGVADMAAALLMGEVPPELTEVLDARAGGTPLFIEALVNTFIQGELLVHREQWTLSSEASKIVPRGVSDLIGERLERIGHFDRRVLELVAVAGEAASHSLLKAVLEVDDLRLIAALGRLQSAGLLSDQIAEGELVYRVEHPMVREVAYANLPEITRRRLHGLVSAELEQIDPEDVERLAIHYRGAGSEAPRDRALEVTLAAAERAQERYAHEEAARNFTAALALIRQTRDSEQMAAILESLGQAWEHVGERAAAVAVWTEALEQCQKAADYRSVARLRRQLAMVEWDRGRLEVAEGHLAAGIQALDPSEACEELADLYHARSIFRIRLDDPDGANEAARHLLDLGHVLRSPRVRAEAHLASANLEAMRGHLEAAQVQAALALDAALAAQDPLLQHRAVGFRGMYAMLAGDLEQAIVDAEENLRQAQRMGTPSLEMLPRARLVMAHVLCGRFEKADRLSAQTLTLIQRVGPPRLLPGALASRAFLLAVRGQLDETAALLADARAGGPPADRNVFDFVDFADAVLAMERGDFAGAAEQLERLTTFKRLQPITLSWLGQAQAAAGQIDAALETAGQLAERSSAPGSYLGALAQRVEGLARLQRGELDAAADCFTRAAEAFAGLESSFELAAVRLDLALATAKDRPAAAATAAQQSLDGFERLRAPGRADRARQLLRRLGQRPVRRRPARKPGEALRGREREVAALAAAGLTNQEIADRLFISVRTVTSHLDHIYARLGIGSRAQLSNVLKSDGQAVT